MAAASMAQTRAYLGIDGQGLDPVLNPLRREAERYVRRNVLVGDLLRDPPANERDFLYQYPDYLVPAQLVIIKWMFERREGPAEGKSVPDISGYILGFERTGLDTDGPLAVHLPSEILLPPMPFFYLGWTQAPPAVGFDMDLAQALAQVITQDDFDHAARADGNGPLAWPMAHFTANSANGWGYYWIAVEDGRGEPPGGVASNGIPQGTGLTANGTTGFTDPNTELDLEFWIWPTALNVTALGDGSRNLTLLGYTDA